MEVIRVEKNSNYTTISNVFLKDLNLSLKTKGFMAMVMALPNDWKFTVGGMAAICKEGKTAIYTALKELIQVGYAKRTYLYGDVKKDGVIMKLRTGVSYSISETPIYLDLDNVNQDTLNQDNLNLGKLNDNNKVTTKSSTKSNQVKSKLSKDSVVTDIPPLESNLNLSEIPTGSEKTGKPINLENVKTETFKKEKEKVAPKEKEAGGEKLDIDAKIAPLGMSAEKLDFIFLEASRIDTPEVRGKFIDWHVRRAKETNGVRTCAIYAKKMRLIANSDLELWEVLQGLEIAYEAAWIDIQPDWVKKRTRQNNKQQNGTNNATQSIKNTSKFFQGA